MKKFLIISAMLFGIGWPLIPASANNHPYYEQTYFGVCASETDLKEYLSLIGITDIEWTDIGAVMARGVIQCKPIRVPLSAILDGVEQETVIPLIVDPDGDCAVGKRVSLNDTVWWGALFTHARDCSQV